MVSRRFGHVSVDRVLALLCGGIAFAIYLLTLAPGVLGGDIGELQYAAPSFRLPHPTGYPFHLVLGWLWTQVVQVGTDAWRMNALSALSGAIAVIALYSAIRVYGTRFAAIAGALALAVSPVMWSQSIVADKYALNVALTVIVLWATARLCATPTHRSALVLAACTGLALTHHRSALVLVPGGVVLCVLLDRSLRRSPRLLAEALLALLLPLTLYAVLPIAAARAWDTSLWQDPRSLSGWLIYILDQNFLAEIRPGVNLVDQLQRYQASALAQFAIPGLLVAALGALWLITQPRWRAFGLFLTLTFAAQVILSSGYNVPRQWLFYMPSFAILAVLIGAGISSLAWRGRLWPAIGAVCILLAVRAPGIVDDWARFRVNSKNGGPLDLYRNDLRYGYQAERFVANSLPFAQANATILADWEQATPLWQAQLVDGMRPDVKVRYPTELLTPTLVANGPVYIARTYPTLGAPYRFSAEGALLRVRLEPSTDMPANLIATPEQFEGAIQLLGMSELDGPGTHHSARYGIRPVALHFRGLGASRPDLSVSLRLIAPDKGLIWQEDRAAFALGMFPTSRWREGEVVSDYFEVSLPEQMSAGDYGLQLVIYEHGAGGLRNLRTARGEEQMIITTWRLP